jgi:hypothetical protein
MISSAVRSAEGREFDETTAHSVGSGNRSNIPDWKKAIPERLAPAKLDPMSKAEVVEELAAHLDDRY